MQVMINLLQSEETVLKETWNSILDLCYHCVAGDVKRARERTLEGLELYIASLGYSVDFVSAAKEQGPNYLELVHWPLKGECQFINYKFSICRGHPNDPLKLIIDANNNARKDLVEPLRSGANNHRKVIRDKAGRPFKPHLPDPKLDTTSKVEADRVIAMEMSEGDPIEFCEICPSLEGCIVRVEKCDLKPEKVGVVYWVQGQNVHTKNKGTTIEFRVWGKTLDKSGTIIRIPDKSQSTRKEKDKVSTFPCTNIKVIADSLIRYRGQLEKGGK